MPFSLPDHAPFEPSPKRATNVVAILRIAVVYGQQFHRTPVPKITRWGVVDTWRRVAMRTILTVGVCAAGVCPGHRASVG